SLLVFPLHNPTAVLAGVTCGFTLQGTTRCPLLGRRRLLALRYRLVGERHDRRYADRAQMAGVLVHHTAPYLMVPPLLSVPVDAPYFGPGKNGAEPPA